MMSKARIILMLQIQCPHSAHRRILEISHTLKSLFDLVIQTTLYPRSQVNIYVQLKHDSASAKTFQDGILKKEYWEATFEDCRDLNRRAPQHFRIATLLGFGDNKAFVKRLRICITIHSDHEHRGTCSLRPFPCFRCKTRLENASGDAVKEYV
ncbi:hypothetical protein D9757_013231 [Collybiopsis confluens]|uniref:Uncharacterized protein n=1 Tax=Collybiopsis confluens TaxID=2823264 RepID=A0A8H5CBM8_9AGAR|nr:hypothetical protein D9757_015449 [Collybiopsis confluens]KAF5361224.1 hypothetical protein D9757_013231 [Collybiopsis confluens]